jgi:hypothetical protein
VVNRLKVLHKALEEARENPISLDLAVRVEMGKGWWAAFDLYSALYI